MFRREGDPQQGVPVQDEERGAEVHEEVLDRDSELAAAAREEGNHREAGADKREQLSQSEPF